MELFNSFSTNLATKAWNLPTLQLNANLDFNITKKWYAGTNIFYANDRNDQQINLDLVPIPTDNIKNINSYFDVNAHLGFKYSDRLTAFIKTNNIANQQYFKWLNYPVQGFQVIMGANYKFDF
jgi:outer membrane receptor protein involved in Fe transport